jgi:hypothetical protein
LATTLRSSSSGDWRGGAAMAVATSAVVVGVVVGTVGAAVVVVVVGTVGAGLLILAAILAHVSC